jgi:predicted metal-dependent hydrolase
MTPEQNLDALGRLETLVKAERFLESIRRLTDAPESPITPTSAST